MTNPIIVPLRNGLALTRAAHPTFAAQDIPGGVEVLYIDNNSQDGTAQFLASLPDVRVIRNGTPRSVAASWNQGLRWWFGLGAEYALVVNNDVELRRDTYRLLVEDGGGFVTCVGVNDRAQMAGRAERRPNPDFSAYLIRREVWKKVGEFDENFLIGFCEDWDYHCRLHQAGIEAMCIGVPFYHVGSATIKALDEDRRKAVEEQAARNRAYFRKKWGFEGGSPEYYAFFAK